MEYQPKSIEKYTHFLHCTEVLKVLIAKICKMQPLDILFLVYFISMLDCTSADIIFHSFLELHTKLSEKKDFRHKFFLTDSLNTPPPTPLT